METVNTILGIIASVLSIGAIVWSGVNAKKIKSINKTNVNLNSNNKIRGKAKGGDGSTNTVGAGNTIR